jgi:LysR family hydrogen peroxide-inducible transcriptional activator
LAISLLRFGDRNSRALENPIGTIILIGNSYHRRLALTLSAELTLKQLRCLLAVEKFGHFRRASEHLGVTQPSLSAQILKLETTLGLQLVDRNRAGVALTPSGRDIARRAQRVVEEEQAILDYAAGAQKGISGTIRLGTAPTLGPYFLPHLVAALHRKHSGLGLYIREEAPHDLEYELGKGTYDLLLTPTAGPQAEFVTEPLFREPLYLAVAVDHPLAGQVDLPAAAIKGLKILTLSPQHLLHDQVASICNTFGAVLARDYEGTSLDALRQMVGMGMGATFLPALYVHSEVRPRSEIAAIRLSGRMLVRTIALSWRKSAGRAQAYREIAKEAREIARKKFKDLIVD